MLKIKTNFRKYLQDQQLAKSTIKNYVSDLRHFLDWLASSHQQVNINNFNYNQFRAYKNYLSQNDVGRSVVRRRLAGLKKFGEFLKTENLTNTNPAAHVKPNPPRITVYQQLKEFKKFLKDHDLSKSTIKNYMADVSQFVHWTERQI